MEFHENHKIYTLYSRGCKKVWYQGILKATVSGVFEDLKFKISEGLDQNWSCPDSALLAVTV
jgi:hypothetical protein